MKPEYIFTASLIGAVVSAGIGSWCGSTKNRDTAGMFMGLFFGPIGWIVVLLMPPLPPRTGPAWYEYAPEPAAPPQAPAPPKPVKVLDATDPDIAEYLARKAQRGE